MLCTSVPFRSSAHPARNPRPYACPTPPQRRIYVTSMTSDSFINVKKAAAIVFGTGLLMTAPAWADLNKFEAAVGGEFGNGTAQQYGEATIVGKDFHGEVGGGLALARSVIGVETMMSGSIWACQISSVLCKPSFKIE